MIRRLLSRVGWVLVFTILAFLTLLLATRRVGAAAIPLPPPPGTPPTRAVLTDRYIVLDRFDVSGMVLAAPPLDSTTQFLLLPMGSTLSVPRLVVDSVRTRRNPART